MPLAISYFILLSQPLFVPCQFEKSTEKDSVIFKIAGVNSSHERSVMISTGFLLEKNLREETIGYYFSCSFYRFFENFMGAPSMHGQCATCKFQMNNENHEE